MDATPPTTFEEIQNTQLWWTTHFLGSNFGFTQFRARQLARRGLWCLRDLWIPGTMELQAWPVLKDRFNLREPERRLITQIHAQVPPAWRRLGQTTATQSIHGEWLGLFPREIEGDPWMIFRTSPAFCPALRPGPQFVFLPATVDLFKVGAQSRTLILQDPHSPRLNPYYGFLQRIRVICLPRRASPRSLLTYKYLAPVSRLTFDPGRWQWCPGVDLFSYSSSQGRVWRRPRLQLQYPISEKWEGLVPPDFRPDWHEVWVPGRPRKEAGFLWSLLHRAIAVNHWRRQTVPTLSDLCTCCTQGEPETLIHAFYACPEAAAAWRFAATIFYRLYGIPDSPRPWTPMSWQQCLLGFELPGPIRHLQGMWSLLRGSVLWIIWIRRNTCVFANVRWSRVHLEQVIWDATMDLARVAWLQARLSGPPPPTPAGRLRRLFALRDFEARWAATGTLCSVQGLRLHWRFQRPLPGVFRD